MEAPAVVDLSARLVPLAIRHAELDLSWSVLAVLEACPVVQGRRVRHDRPPLRRPARPVDQSEASPLSGSFFFVSEVHRNMRQEFSYASPEPWNRVPFPRSASAPRIPVLPSLDPTTGLLPRGRHVCTAAEVEIAFVKDVAFSGSPTRPDLWSEWNTALAVLQSSVTVHAAWLGGSFTTSKLDPEDIDVTFIINGEDLRQRGPNDQRIVSLFKGGGLVKANLGLRVDSYTIPWEPYLLGPVVPVHNEYIWARGYWDDWWQRARQSPKGSPPQPGDVIPRRGYLEVLASDYPS